MEKLLTWGRVQRAREGLGAAAASQGAQGTSGQPAQGTGTALGTSCLLQELKRTEGTGWFPCVGGRDAPAVSWFHQWAPDS